MRRFQLELIYLYFPPSSHLVYLCFCPVGLSTLNCPSQETEVTSTPTRPVDNVVITTKGIQDRNINILDGTTVENKGKLILIDLGILIWFMFKQVLTPHVHLSPLKGHVELHKEWSRLHEYHNHRWRVLGVRIPPGTRHFPYNENPMRALNTTSLK